MLLLNIPLEADGYVTQVGPKLVAAQVGGCSAHTDKILAVKLERETPPRKLGSWSDVILLTKISLFCEKLESESCKC